MSETPVIMARGLTRYYGSTVGVEDLHLDVFQGEVFGFLGPNGAGKTTTIRLLLDLIRPTRGRVSVLGVPAHHSSVRSRVGYLPGDLVFDGRMTGIDTLRFLARLDGSTGRRDATEKRRSELADQLHLTTRDLRRRVREYSRGTRQKLGIIAAFQHDPELLVLDEPTTSLDPLVRETVFELMASSARKGTTVFHSSHVLSEVERTCHRVAMLRAGRLITTMRVEDVRNASIRRVVVEFADAVARDELDLAGVEVVLFEGSRAELTVTGGLGALLGVLSRHEVRHLALPEPGLEQAFARHYRPEETAK